MKNLLPLCCASALAALAGCSGSDSSGGQSNAKLRSVSVFGVAIVATDSVPEDKILHAANILAQYLDNDADGSADNPAVVAKMHERQATLMMLSDDSEFSVIEPALANPLAGQDLRTEETLPHGIPHVDGAQRFDASLEEVLHLITHNGYAQVYPQVFGEAPGSVVADAMDIARGGHFQRIPASYPDGAWYTYDDTTCDYACMIAEYTYWGLTSKLGAQRTRAAEIGHEWKLVTPQQFQSGDPALYNLLNDAQYALPTVLPDGNYRAGSFTVSRGQP